MKKNEEKTVKGVVRCGTYKGQPNSLNLGPGLPPAKDGEKVTLPADLAAELAGAGKLEITG